MRSVHDLRISDANHGEVLAPQPNIPARVIIGPQIVHTAVDLDNQPGRQTGEIDHIVPDRDLATKAKPV
tara:strand:- start:873 stop:1079 length:207 start_codon:yes stop_codon:yes gene_type:complete